LAAKQPEPKKKPRNIKANQNKGGQQKTIN